MWINAKRYDQPTKSAYHARIHTICAGFLRQEFSSTPSCIHLSNLIVEPIVSLLLRDTKTYTLISSVAQGNTSCVPILEDQLVLVRSNLLGGLTIPLFYVCHSHEPDTTWERFRKTFGEDCFGDEEILQCMSFVGSWNEHAVETLARLLEIKGSWGTNGFFLACKYIREDLVRLLMKNAKRLGLKYDRFFLMESPFWKNPGIVRLFVEHREEIEWDVNDASIHGVTALYHTATSGYLESVRVLVESAHETGLQVHNYFHPNFRRYLIPYVASICAHDGEILKLLLENAQVLKIDMNNIHEGHSAKEFAERFPVKKSADIFRLFVDT